ncbi:T7SS effector LXG polymorphic toxin [Bacillus sp. FSL W7-1360]
MKILDVNKAVTKLDEDMAVLQRMLDFFSLVESGMDSAVNMEGSMTGEGGEAIIRNHSELQLPTVRAFRAHISSTIEKINKMKGYILDFEPSENGVVTEDYWDTQMNRNLDKVEESTEQSKSNVDALTNSVSHIINLGKLNVDNVLNRVESSRKFAGETVDGLHTLDADGVDLMSEVQADSTELKATVKNAVEWMNTGGLTMSGVNIQDVRGYFADATLHTQAPAVDWSNDMFLNLKSSSDPTLRQHVSVLYTLAAIGAHPDVVAAAAKRLDTYLGRPVSQSIIQKAVLTQHSTTEVYAMAFPLTAQATYLRQVREAMSNTGTGAIGEGKVIYKWEGHGDKMTARGAPVDYEALGIRPSVEPVGDYDIRFTVVDGQFILFRDDPDLVYYTQGARTGTWGISTTAAKLTKKAAYAYGLYATGAVANRIPGLGKVNGKANEILSEDVANFGRGFLVDEVQNHVPVWKEIVGTPVPKSGTEQVLVYISSDDGKTWDEKILFTLEPNSKRPKLETDFGEGFEDSFKGLFGLEDK